MAFLLDAEEYAQKITILKKKLKYIYSQIKNRKYPTDLLSQAIQQVRNMARLTILRPSPRENLRITLDASPFTTQGNPTYSRYLRNLKVSY